ncbi:MAG: hypothetical protein H7317_03100 [Pseudorhodobacter sp.]|nr:hypothetical protein [Pseudorhodobacter sp.]
MVLILKTFVTDETGAVTVDWVVLTAAIIGVGMFVLAPIAFTTDSSAHGVAAYINNVNVGYDNN